MAIYNGNQKVTLSGIGKIYFGTQKVYEKINKVLTSISVSNYTSRIAQNGSFSFGGTVTANYSDGSTENVTSSSSFSGYNMAIAGVYTVTVSYTEDGVNASTTYSLTVYGSNVLFSGTKSITLKSNQSAGSNVNIYQDNNMRSGIYKITFIKSGDYTSSSGYYDTTSTSNPSSPWSTIINADTNKVNILSISWSSGSYRRSIAVRYNASEKLFYLEPYSAGGNYTYSTKTITLSVTKLEYVVE